MTWMKIEMDAAAHAANRHGELQDDFERLHLASLAPTDAAMLGRPGEEPASETYYFTPDAVRFCKPVLAKHGAEECSPPTNRNLGLIVGTLGVSERLLGPAQTDGEH